MSKHTPGPWVVSDADIYPQTGATLGFYIDADSGGGGRVAKAISNCRVTTEGECHANACLIAAAPDLLEALENLLDAAASSSIPSQHPAKLDAYAALNKARGYEQ